MNKTKMTSNYKQINSILDTSSSPTKPRQATPKVIKRKAPTPSSSIADKDIAISRPIPLKKIEPGQGMLPPPPPPPPPLPWTSSSSSNTTAKSLDVPILIEKTTSSTSPLPSSPSCTPLAQTKVRTQTPPPIIVFTPTDTSPLASPILDTVITDSSENLVKLKEPSLDANKAATSPPLTLRPYKKVSEVTTIKRQAKNGWL